MGEMACYFGQFAGVNFSCEMERSGPAITRAFLSLRSEELIFCYKGERDSSFLT